jgi:DNA mismatch endonuclease (patch repair protein)
MRETARFYGSRTMSERGEGQGTPEAATGPISAEHPQATPKARRSPVNKLPIGRIRPTPKSELVSQQMSRMPRQNTKPELLLRRELHARGLRFRIHAKLPGRPDVVFTRAKIAVFVDGCFWHGCPEHGMLPKNNREWWRAKIEGNIQRDRAKDKALGLLGWDVMHVWEHEDPEAAAERVEGLWRTKTFRPRAAPG